MKHTAHSLSKFSSLKIVLCYAVVSAVYIYASDYFLRLFTREVEFLSTLQTYKGLGFILITSLLLYILVKRNLNITSSYFQKIIDVQETADKQIASSREEYMLLFDNSPLPMWLFDPATLQFLLVNETACSVYGFSREEFLSMTLRDIRSPEDLSSMEKAFSLSSQSARFTFPDVIRHKKKCGEIMQVKIKVVFVNFEGKKVRLASVVDVTAEMNIQNKLIETNSRLQLASEIAGLGYWTNDLVNSKIQWSDEIYQIFELDPKTFELTLNNIKERFHPEDQLHFDQDLSETFENGTIKESERRIISNSGKIKWVLERQYVTKDINESPVSIHGIVLDITKRKLNEQQIRESNERFKMLAKATVEAIIDWDILNNEVTWGDGFHTLLGYDLSKSNSRLWSNNIHPDDREKILKDLNTTIADPTKQYFNAEFRFLKANGDIVFVQHKGIFIRDGKGKATRALGAMIDLTEVLEKMRKIEWQEKTLKDIAWIQSHVVRAPLANLMGLIGLIKNKVNKGVSDEELLEYISDSAKKLDNIIHDIVRKTTEGVKRDSPGKPLKIVEG